jgi:hypothetical protein
MFSIFGREKPSYLGNTEVEKDAEIEHPKEIQ